MTDDINSLRVPALRQFVLDTEELKEEYTEEEVAKMKKPELVQIVSEYTAALAQNESDDFSIEYEENEQPVNSMQEALPRYGTSEWQTYVLSLLQPDEQYDGCPKASGLRRIAQLLLGDIIFSGAESISVIPQESGRAVTVNYRVTFAWKLDFGISALDLSSVDLERRTFLGVADCIENQECIYARHPAATAETKAMARALKTALCINVVTADEKMSGVNSANTAKKKDILDESPAHDSLKRIVTQWADKGNVDITSQLKENMVEITGGTQKSFDQLTSTEMKKLYSIMSATKQD